jgi:DNA helicase HerA-like ATPase
MYVEEAHNLIGRDADFNTTWPRIAKEGAKFGIALVYATQEPSSVHPNIMANTENFFVTHLNNDDELRSLGKYYDFADFLPSLKKAQDVGFARIKTLSSPFVVPTQIRKFDPETLKSEYDRLERRKDFKPAPSPEGR